MKKTLKIIFVILLIAGFAMFLIWLLSPKGQSENQNFIGTVREFLPFGKENEIIPPEELAPEEEFFAGGKEVVDGNRSIDATLPDVELVYNEPIAGFAIVGTSTPIARVVEKATGHIIDIDTTTQSQTRISNTTIPSIREVIFFNEGSSVVLRYAQKNNSIIETLIIDNIGTESQTSGTYLEENIISIIPTNNGLLLYVVPQSIGSKIVQYNPATQSSRTITTLSLKEITLLSSTNTYLYLETKASALSQGYVYRVSLQGGELEKVTGGSFGATHTLGDSTNLILSTYGTGGVSTVQNRETGGVFTFNFETVASKCIIADLIYCGIPTSFGENMPDSWFMGLTELNDNIWSIDLESGDVVRVAELANIDVILPQFVDTNLFFIDKKTGFLWIVRINQI